MKFTDDDLKRLKSEIEMGFYGSNRERLKALISRLEAAENALETYEENFHGYDDDSLDAVKAWKKAAGK